MTESHLTEEEKSVIARLEKKIQELVFTPINDEEIQHRKKRYQQGVISGRLEGLYEKPFNKALHELFLSHRVPNDLSTDLGIKIIKERHSAVE